MKPSFTLIISAIFLAYIGHSMYVIYGIFFPEQCKRGSKCIYPYLSRKPVPKFEILVYTSTQKSTVRERDLTLVWKNSTLDVSDTLEYNVNVSLPRKVRNNGTMYVHVFLVPAGQDPFISQYTVHRHTLITTYTLPKSEVFSLIGDTQKNGSSDPNLPLAHWRQKVTINIMNEYLALDRNSIPHDIYRYFKASPDGDYLPVLFIDELSFRVRDLLPINKSCDQMPLSIIYSPISVGKLRFWTHMLHSIETLHQFGFTEKDTDELKGIFADTNFHFLMMTFAVAAFHLLFDFLAFKNDISYWRNRKNMVGLSSRAVLWRCVSTIIVFLYLWDQETSLLVLIPAGIGALIEVWKVKKAFKLFVEWDGMKPKFSFGQTSKKEQETEEFDSQAMKYLSYALMPLCIGLAVYNLLYTPHKSWYSWCIESLVNGVYAFGFLFMLPQLFVNYKLKSVAHLPWRAFTYKAFNTFIDDIFAFIITMPTAHRLACFRDDVVFFFYLYQRWLYPVDKSRVNEFGMSFEDEKEETKRPQKKKRE
uniref:Lipid scramblase CLPTM1L n=1 Tax=Crassostrea virginica TaxID=6565 RepID=A0A8B8EL46_CRAVI|nr:cleft lip and palate transmembrane protein 1-like protein [Crassostrea virginica]XP_022340364.1 cleft lip and palate transmembrane protein 1-like protein [Crassostrea virginica]